MFTKPFLTLTVITLLLLAAARPAPGVPAVTLVPDIAPHVARNFERPQDPAAARTLELTIAALESALKEIKEGDYILRGIRAPKIARKRKQYAQFPEKEKKELFLVEFDSEGRLGSINRILFKDFDKAIEDVSGRYALGIRDNSVGFTRKNEKEILSISRPGMMPTLYVNSVPGERNCQIAWNAQGKIESAHMGAINQETSDTLTVPAFATPLAIIAAHGFGGQPPADARTAARLRASLDALRTACSEADAQLSGVKPRLLKEGSGLPAQYVARIPAADGRSTTTFRFADSAGSGFVEVRKDALDAAGALDKKAGFVIRFRKDGVNILEYRARDSQDTLRFHPNMKLDTYAYPPDRNPQVLYEVHWDETGTIVNQGVKDYGALSKRAAGKK